MTFNLRLLARISNVSVPGTDPYGLSSRIWRPSVEIQLEGYPQVQLCLCAYYAVHSKHTAMPGIFWIQDFESVTGPTYIAVRPEHPHEQALAVMARWQHAA